MGRLIADKCASLFDGHDLDHDLHFFDFFEQTVAEVVSVTLPSGLPLFLYSYLIRTFYSEFVP